MGIRNRDREVIERLESKTLDSRFTTEIQQGLNCSPFESEAVLGVVKEVYFPFLSAEAAVEPSPGKISLVAVAADRASGQARRRLPKANRLPPPFIAPRPKIDEPFCFRNTVPPAFARRGSSTFANRLSARVHSSPPKILPTAFSSSPREQSRETSKLSARRTRTS